MSVKYTYNCYKSTPEYEVPSFVTEFSLVLHITVPVILTGGANLKKVTVSGNQCKVYLTQNHLTDVVVDGDICVDLVTESCNIMLQNTNNNNFVSYKGDPVITTVETNVPKTLDFLAWRVTTTEHTYITSPIYVGAIESFACLSQFGKTLRVECHATKFVSCAGVEGRIYSTEVDLRSNYQGSITLPNAKIVSYATRGTVTAPKCEDLTAIVYNNIHLPSNIRSAHLTGHYSYGSKQKQYKVTLENTHYKKLVLIDLMFPPLILGFDSPMVCTTVESIECLNSRGVVNYVRPVGPMVPLHHKVINPIRLRSSEMFTKEIAEVYRGCDLTWHVTTGVESDVPGIPLQKLILPYSPGHKYEIPNHLLRNIHCPFISAFEGWKVFCLFAIKTSMSNDIEKLILTFTKNDWPVTLV